MAQQTIVTITDDLDGSEGAETVTFALEGTTYEIDLSPANIEKLHEALAPFIEAARGGPRRGRTPARGRKSGNGASGDVDPRTVREWAKANNIDVSPRGRIRSDVVAQFRAAGN